MLTVSTQISKETFIPEKNYFKCEDVEVSREETIEEFELWNNMVAWSNRGMAAIGIGIAVCMLLCISCGCLSAYNPLAYIGIAIGAASFIGGLVIANVVCWPKENECADIRREWYREHEEELWAEATKEIKAYNEEQQKIAEAWRAEHPFEEHIRACIKDPIDSVAIATAAKYYAENYLNK